MAKGISLHIGLNRVNPKRYGGWDGALKEPVNCAKAMRDIAVSLSYDERTLLVDSQATAEKVLKKISDAAAKLVAGDIFLITYAGHGGWQYDQSGDEADGMDETWVLYDRQCLDDELAVAWSQFKAGVRIVMVSDSCHSGTVLKAGAAPEQVRINAGALSFAGEDDGGWSPQGAFTEIDLKATQTLSRADVVALLRREFSEHKVEYASIKANNKPAAISASMILLAACQDDEVTYGTGTYGVFTAALLEIWNNGAFSGTYPSFLYDISVLVPPEQTPNFEVAGTDNFTFRAQTPFTKAAPPARPTIRAAVEWGNGNVYFFFDGYYSRYVIASGKMDDDFPRPIADDWPGLWTDRIDAAVNWGNGKVYFFRGTEYCRYDIEGDKTDPDFPYSTRKGWTTLWPSVSTLSIDAAVKWSGTHAYFFRGNEYTYCNLVTQNAESGYPRVTSTGWPGVWSGTIDAAVNWGNGKIYLFKGAEYICYDIDDDRTDTGFPKAIPVDWRNL